MGKGGSLEAGFARSQVEEVSPDVTVMETQGRNEPGRNLQSSLEASAEFTAGCSPLITTDSDGPPKKQHPDQAEQRTAPIYDK